MSRLDLVLHTKNDELTISEYFHPVILPALGMVCPPQGEQLYDEDEEVETDSPTPKPARPHFVATRNNIIDLGIQLTCDCEGCATNRLKDVLCSFLNMHRDETVLILFGHIQPAIKREIGWAIDYLENGVDIADIQEHLLNDILC